MTGPTLLERLTALPPGTLLGSMVRAPLRLIPRDSVMTVRAGLNKGASWIAGASVHGCWLGTYEPDQQRAVAELVRPGTTVWDVGANAGFYTLAFSRLVGSRGRVYAFEPLAENSSHLLAHLRLNRARNVVQVQAALGAVEDTATFEVAASNSMGRLSSAAGSCLVPCLTLDTFVERHPEAAPDLIKVDIEGGESALLEGGAQFLRRHNPTILLSLHGAEQRRRCAELLELFGYSLHRLDGTGPTNGVLENEILARKGPEPNR